MKIKCPDCSTSYEIKSEALGPEGRSVKCAKCGNRWYVTPEDDDEASIDFKPSGDDAEVVEAPGDGDPEKDEADWAADTEDEAPVEADEPGQADTDDQDAGAPEDKPQPASAKKSRDEDKFAADLKDDTKAEAEPQTDIESSAKRPKIIVNPNKFRRNHITAALNWLFRRNFRRMGGFALFAAAIAVCAALIVMRDDIVKRSPDLASLFQMIGFDVNLRGLEFRNLRTFTEVEDGKRVLVVEGSIRNLLDERNTVPAVRLSIRSADLQEVYAWTVEPRTKSLNALDETRFRTILAEPPSGASDLQVRFVDRGKRQLVLE